MNLVVGATGILGSEICRRLVAQGKPVRGLVRSTADQSKLNTLTQLGVALVYGDLKERASLDAACQDVEAIITTASTTFSRQPDDSIEATDHAGALNLVAAAQAAGVRHFIYTSYVGSLDTGPDPCPLTIAKRTVERAVQASGMIYTILRPSCFMEIWLGPALGFDAVNASATIYGAGRSKLSWISLGDVAEFAVQSLDNPTAYNTVLELGGPEPLSQLEIVKLFEEMSGTPFTLTHVPVEALQAQKAGATDSLQHSLATLMLSLVEDHAVDMDETLKAFPVSLSSVKDYASRTLGWQVVYESHG
jgi:uncharacterized protein YbjT (DUF2867 family)